MIINPNAMREEIEKLFSFDLTKIEQHFDEWVEEFCKEVQSVFTSPKAVNFDRFIHELTWRKGWNPDEELKMCLSEDAMISISEEGDKLLQEVISSMKPFKGFVPIYRAYNAWVQCTGKGISHCSDKARQYSWVRCAKHMLAQIYDGIMVFYGIECDRYDQVISKWARLHRCGKWIAVPDAAAREYQNFALFVSMGVEKYLGGAVHYPVISCSFITDKHSKFYYQNNSSIGWVFDFNPNDVVFMAPEDANMCCDKDRAASLRTSFLAGITVGNDGTLQASASGLQAIVSPAEMENGMCHNEVVLRGDTVPVGVLTFADEYKESYHTRLTVHAISYLRGIQIYLYDALRNTVIILPKRECEKLMLAKD